MCTYWQTVTCTGLHKNADKNHTTNYAKSQCETKLGGLSIDQQLCSTTYC